MLRLGKAAGMGAVACVVVLLFASAGGAQESIPGESPAEAREPRDAAFPVERFPFEERARRHLPPGLARRLEQGWARMAPGAEARLRQGLERLPPQWRPHVRAFQGLMNRAEGRRMGGGVAAALVLLLVLVRLVRRPGDLVVCLEYPAGLRGSFSVELGRNVKAVGRQSDARRERSSTRSLHNMVARETQFRAVRPGRYWVGVDGTLADPTSGEVVKRPHQALPVGVRSRRTARLEFDFRPDASVVTVKVFWDGRPALEAAVAQVGEPSSVRYARGGQATLELPKGQHRIAVGSGDRVAEREVESTSFEGVTVEVDLSGSESDVVFTGCPPAVAPYLQGDLLVAAQALAREGQQELANLIEARQYERDGRSARAARHYQKAGDTENAIRMLLDVQPEQAGYREACVSLAEAFERQGQLELAIERIERALEGAGLDDEARPGLLSRLANLFEQYDDLPGALEILQKLRREKPDHPNLVTRIETIEKQLSREPVVSSEARPARTAEPPLSRYELLEQIGAGGMGVVFRARDRRLGREVALKRLPENLREHPVAVELFLREARAAAALNHANIVTLFDADEEDGTFFITMELLKGVPLGALLRRHGRLSARDTSLLGMQVAAGLAYAHERRIVHRDIKPANLFYTNERVVKIMDFGLAKMIEEVRRGATVLGGTTYYMAPEQAGEEPVDEKVDVYALGVTLFELCVGRVPFRDGDVAHDHRHTPPPDPRTLVEEVPDALAALIVSMLAKDPFARPDAASIGDRLRGIAAV